MAGCLSLQSDRLSSLQDLAVPWGRLLCDQWLVSGSGVLNPWSGAPRPRACLMPKAAAPSPCGRRTRLRGEGVAMGTKLVLSARECVPVDGAGTQTAHPLSCSRWCGRGKKTPQTGESAPGTGLCLGAPEDRRSGDAGFGVWSALSWGPGLDPNLGHTLPRSGSLGAPCRLLGSGGSGHDVWGPAHSLRPAPGQHAGAERPG